ncbi:MAG: hypothetical protein KBD10_01110 [Candidatus Pacebacteria bacterium]|jgi:hypothetical protein|nr:hypothetical protein [Candidatus Paceibacterota bacterium]
MESFKPSFEAEENINKSSFSKYLDGVNENLISGRLAEKNGEESFKKYYVEKLERELSEDPELEALYDTCIKGENIELLRKKSERQLQELENVYVDNPSLFELGNFVERQNKLMDFIRAIDKFSVVLSTTESDRKEFTAPRQRGESKSFGFQDAIIHADKYVYASFAEIPHYMTGPLDSHHTKLNMDKETQLRSHMVFQDYANIIARSENHPTREYLNNMFDYDTGKRILATYLASVFDSVDEAVEFIKRNNDPYHAQRWDEALQDENIKARMQKIKEKTGIEPPLSFEIKIPNNAYAVE